MDPSLDMQKAIRARLIASPALVSVVPADNVLDHNSRPEVSPMISIGEGQSLLGPGIKRTRYEVYADLHIWTEEPGLASAKAIAGLIRDALRDGFWTLTAHHVADAYIQTTRFLRDPDGKHGHGIITLRAHLVEVT
jgi:Protein of unknown function (DUF3168)